MNTFLGVNMSQNPGLGFNIAILIPILAGVSQFISVKIAQGKQQVDDDNPAAASMKMMTLLLLINLVVWSCILVMVIKTILWLMP